MSRVTFSNFGSYTLTIVISEVATDLSSLTIDCDIMISLFIITLYTDKPSD